MGSQPIKVLGQLRDRSGCSVPDRSLSFIPWHLVCFSEVLWMQNFVANKTSKGFPEKKHLHRKRQEDLVLGDDSEHDLQFYLKVKGREIWNFSASFTIFNWSTFQKWFFWHPHQYFLWKRSVDCYLAEGPKRFPQVFPHNLHMLSHTLLMN